jgi:hypothetical protein
MIPLAVAAALAVLVLAAFPTVAAGQAPPPCGGQPQISDPTGDGHHPTTDVLSAWFSEAAGRLQAVIKVQAGNWFPDHPPGPAQWALLFDVGGQTRYVRAVAPDVPPVSFDYGTWAAPDVFTSAGPTIGALIGGLGGTATIDVPGQTGAVAGAVLTNPFVLTYDGDGLIDRAPGLGTTPIGSEFGADYVVGSCGGAGTPGGGTPGSGGGGGAGGVSAVQLLAPAKRVGAGRVRVRGSIVPAWADVPVELTMTGRSAVLRLTTRADGAFSTSLRLTQTSSLRAMAGGLRSEVRTITVFSKTRIIVRRLRGGGVLVRGRVNPALPGRVLLLRTDAVRPSARTSARKGRFRFRFNRLRPGRYQAVFIPSKGRAERSTSNKGAVR